MYIRPPWRRLLDRAGRRALPPLTDDPDLHLLVEGTRVDAEEQQGAVYLFHLPMVVALQYALADAPLPAAVKFVVVAVIVVPTAFAFTFALRRWSVVRRII